MTDETTVSGAADGPLTAFVPRLAPEVVMVDVEDEAILYAPSSARLHLLDPIGSLVCKLFDGTASVGELATDLAAAFGVPDRRIARDVLALVDQLGSHGLVVAQDGSPIGRDDPAGGNHADDDDRAVTPTDAARPRLERIIVDGC